MQGTIRDALDALVPLVEAAGGLVVFVGAVRAFVTWVASQVRPDASAHVEIRLALARYLALALEFQLGADILSTAISPSFDDIGKLAAIAAIRTALQFSLAREIRGAGAPTASSS